MAAANARGSLCLAAAETQRRCESQAAIANPGELLQGMFWHCRDSPTSQPRNSLLETKLKKLFALLVAGAFLTMGIATVATAAPKTSSIYDLHDGDECAYGPNETGTGCYEPTPG